MIDKNYSHFIQTGLSKKKLIESPDSNNPIISISLRVNYFSTIALWAIQI